MYGKSMKNYMMENKSIKQKPSYSLKLDTGMLSVVNNAVCAIVSLTNRKLYPQR